MDEDFETLVMRCTNCQLEFYAKELRIDPQTEMSVCTNCRSIPGSKITIIRDRPLTPRQKAVQEPPATIAAKSPVKPAMMSFGDYRSFKCSSCQYTFKRKSNFRGNCPYCSKNSAKALKEGIKQ